MGAPVSTTDWKRCTAHVTLGVSLLVDGTYTATLTSYYGEPRRWRRHTLDAGQQDMTLAPPALAALREAAQQAIDAWFEGDIE